MALVSLLCEHGDENVFQARLDGPDADLLDSGPAQDGFRARRSFLRVFRY